MNVNQDAQTLNSTLPATMTGEIGGLVNADRPFNAEETTYTSTVDDDDAGPPSGADDKGAKGGEDGTTPTGEKKPGEAAKGGEGEGDEETRFDQHPRFQQLIKERDEAKATADAERITRERLSAQMEILTKVVEPPPKPTKAEAPPFKDTADMPEDELAQWQANDPKGYEANLAAKIKHELLTDLNKHAEVNSRQNAVDQTYATFAEQNADFNDRWKTGEIKQYIDQHPGHNPMSAYLVMSADAREKTTQARIDEAVAKAKVDTEKEVLDRVKAKQKVSVMSGQEPAATITVPGKEDSVLNYPKSQGGMKAGLAQMLATMRRQPNA